MNYSLYIQGFENIFPENELYQYYQQMNYNPFQYYSQYLNSSTSYFFEQNLSNTTPKYHISNSIQAQPHFIQNNSVENKTIKKIKKIQKSKCVQKQILSAKKNSESNIINQFYSFFASFQISKKIVTKFIQSNHKSQHIQNILFLFYKFIRLINIRRGRKYINRTMILNFFTPSQLNRYSPQIVTSLKQINFITVNQLCLLYRQCCAYFLNKISIIAILTSKRITSVSRQQHLRKRRSIKYIISHQKIWKKK